MNIQMECMALLTSQLEKQKQYWEEKLEELAAQLKEEKQKDIG